MEICLCAVVEECREMTKVDGNVLLFSHFKRINASLHFVNM